MDQKVRQDKVLYYFASYSTKHFTQKPIPQPCCKIMLFKMNFTVKPTVSMKPWGKLSYTFFMKEKIEIITTCNIGIAN